MKKNERCIGLRFAPIVGLAFMLGATTHALGQTGACVTTEASGNGPNGSGVLVCTSGLGCCFDSLTQTSCESNGGWYQGDGTTCADDKGDCDCDGILDVEEIEDCVDACIGGGGSAAGCEAACDMNGDGRPNGCDPSVAIAIGPDCCDPGSGAKTTIADGFGCTVDACEPGGTPSHTPDHAFCDDANDCTDDICVPGCSNPPLAAGTACGDTSDTDCDNPDTCDGSGSCDDNFEPALTACTDDGNECTADRCNATGTCVHPAAPLNGTACTDDGNDCTDDVCSAGSCTHPNYPDGTLCNVGGALAGLCDLADSCCSGVCEDIVASAGTACSGAAGECWDQATCGGGVPGCGFGNKASGAASYACNDNPTASGINCGDPSHGPCDRQDKCDGAGACDPRPRAAGYVCGADDGSGCDVEDVCNGTEMDPCTDVKQPPCTPCGNADDTLCNAPDSCGGGANAGVCINRVDPSSSVCRASTGECDPAESCLGGKDLGDGCLPEYDPGGVGWVPCPADASEPGGTVCGNAGDGACDLQDTCSGAGYTGGLGVCVDRVASAASMTICRALGAGGADAGCDVVEHCPGGASAGDGLGNEDAGSAKVCPADAHAAGGTACVNKPVSGDCDLPDRCSDAAYSGALGSGSGHCVNRVRGPAYVCRPAVSGACDGDETCPGGAVSGDGFGREGGTMDKHCPPDSLAGGSGLCTMFQMVQNPTIDETFEDGCWTIEVYVADTSATPLGVTCAFIDVEPGTAGCPVSILGVDLNEALFPDFNNFVIERGGDGGSPDSDRVLDMGGCTNVAGVGAGEWVLLGLIEVVAPQDECTVTTVMDQAVFTDSSLHGVGIDDAFFDASMSSGDVEINCWGHLYDHVTPEMGFVDAGDLSDFATCWMSCDAACSEFDYDMDGCVGPGDLAFFATAWQRLVCAGGIAIPIEQLTCPPRTTEAGGVASVPGANGFVQDSDGNIEPVVIPWATVEDMGRFGLPVPPADWDGWSRTLSPTRPQRDNVDKRLNTRASGVR